MHHFCIQKGRVQIHLGWTTEDILSLPYGSPVLYLRKLQLDLDSLNTPESITLARYILIMSISPGEKKL